MIRFFSIGIVLLLLSTNSYSQLFEIPEEYRGDSYISTANMKKIERDCVLPNDYWDMNDSQRKEIDRKCTLNHLEFDFSGLYNLIDKSTVIFENDTLKLVLHKEYFDYKIKGDLYVGAKLILSLVKGEFVKDQIILANNFMNQSNSFLLGYQYFYIAPSGDIYILMATESEDRIEPQLWEHYKIDTKNFRFIVSKLHKGRYQIAYPGVFNILTDPNKNVNYDDKDFLECLNNEFKENCSNEDIYVYYFEQLKHKTEELDQKENIDKSSFPALKKRLDKLCLKKRAPSNEDKLVNYLNEITQCEIKNLKQNLKQIEDSLADDIPDTNGALE